jgi:hypothetical protein
LIEEGAMYIVLVNRIRQGVGQGQVGDFIPPHIEWLKGKIQEGFVLQAGRWGDIGGMWLLRARSVEEAGEAVKEDPLLGSGLVTYEMAEYFPMVDIG